MDRATIIDHMLSVIGESGVSSVITTHPSVQTASRILDTEDVDFQQVGHWFNKEYCLKLVANSDGEVIVPQDALEVVVSNVPRLYSPQEKARYVRRGGKMYDTIKHTFVLNTSLYVDMVVRLAIADMPSVAASYLMHKAAKSIYVDDDGDTFKTQELEKRVLEAQQKLHKAALKAVSVNALDNPYSRWLQSGIGQGSSRNPNLIGGLVR